MHAKESSSKDAGVIYEVGQLKTLEKIRGSSEGGRVV